MSSYSELHDAKKMSELRLRHAQGDTSGDPDARKVEKRIPGKYDQLYMGGGTRFNQHELPDLIRMSAVHKCKLNGRKTSNDVQEAKDKLDEDPYDINSITALGDVHFTEFQFDLCANVLLRGWKRVSELSDTHARFRFLMKLCEASYRNMQFKQAHAVLMSIDEPEDGIERKAFLLLACQVHALVNDAPKVLASFSKVIDAESFEVAIYTWAACALALRHVGAFEASKNAVAKKAEFENKGESQIRVVETWSVLKILPEPKKENFMEMVKAGEIPKKLILVLIALCVLFMIWIIYLLEQYNLDRRGLKPWA